MRSNSVPPSMMVRVRRSSRPVEAFRVGDRRDIGRKVQALHQRHDIDAALFQHRAPGQVDLVHGEGVEPLGHCGAAGREKGGTDAVSDLAETQIERGGLDLFGGHGRLGTDHAGLRHVPDRAVGQDSGHVDPMDRVLVGLAGFEPATFRPPDGRANQAAP